MPKLKAKKTNYLQGKLVDACKHLARQKKFQHDTETDVVQLVAEAEEFERLVSLSKLPDVVRQLKEILREVRLDLSNSRAELRDCVRDVRDAQREYEAVLQVIADRK